MIGRFITILMRCPRTVVHSIENPKSFSSPPNNYTTILLLTFQLPLPHLHLPLPTFLLYIIQFLGYALANIPSLFVNLLTPFLNFIPTSSPLLECILQERNFGAAVRPCLEHNVEVIACVWTRAVLSV